MLQRVLPLSRTAQKARAVRVLLLLEATTSTPTVPGSFENRRLHPGRGFPFKIPEEAMESVSLDPRRARKFPPNELVPDAVVMVEGVLFANILGERRLESSSGLLFVASDLCGHHPWGSAVAAPPC